MTGFGVRVRAPAKVNLAFSVFGKRPDGYHEIDTLMMALELADVLEARPVEAGFSLELTGPRTAGVPSDDTNLVLRAARELHALARARGLEPGGVRFALEKNVPAAAGLGGGSSDAAAAAMACAHLWDIDPDGAEVLEVLAGLGSDCPFFMRARESGLARCTGRGEQVEPLPAMVVPHALVVLTPRFGCDTGEVYGAIEPRPERDALSAFELASASAGGERLLQASVFNQLEHAARRAVPALDSFARTLEEVAPGALRLAGSGSSWFGFQSDEAAAKAFLARVEVVLRARRYALRGSWVLPGRSHGMEVLSRRLQ